MRLLDLFCCEGGAAKGYASAGFEVVGVDIEARFGRRYPFEFIHADAITYVREHYVIENVQGAALVNPLTGLPEATSASRVAGMSAGYLVRSCALVPAEACWHGGLAWMTSNS